MSRKKIQFEKEKNYKKQLNFSFLVKKFKQSQLKNIL